MLLLSLLLANTQDIANLITVMARVQRLSLTRLAAESGVHKSQLLRFCKQEQGGYLSDAARQRILETLGWNQTGLSVKRVHTWRVDDIEDARFLFKRALQSSAAISQVAGAGNDVPRVAIGVSGGAPLIVSATYRIESPCEDPMTADTRPLYSDARDLAAASRVDLSVAQRSPKAFFDLFGSGHTVPATAPANDSTHESPLKSLYSFGFSNEQIRELAEDFITLQCRQHPLVMTARLVEKLLLDEMTGQTRMGDHAKGLRQQLESAAKDVIASSASRPFVHPWID